MSILDVNLNDSTITVGIRVLSAKTKSLASAEDKILVRGPYRSGFIGREFRKMDGTVMILCSGAGLCPGIFACNLLRPSAKVLLTVRDAPFERNLVQHFLRPAALPSSGKDGRTVSAMAHQMAGGSVSFRDFDSAEEVEKIRRVIRQEKPKYILLLGSRNFSSGMYKNLEEFHKSPALSHRTILISAAEKESAVPVNLRPATDGVSASANVLNPWDRRNCLITEAACACSESSAVPGSAGTGKTVLIFPVFYLPKPMGFRRILFSRAPRCAIM